jgi:Nucleotidyl transferase AbiEii toxin, Type IV TA system
MMIAEAYKKQVALLLAVLSDVAKESCFALHGGTAINLFVRNMPRLSVDIDLTYLPIEDRATTLAMENQFSGMSDAAFSYDEYEGVRKKLVETIHKSLTDRDKEFLLGVKNLTPDWEIYDFERFPAVAWKLQNLQKLKDTNPEKHAMLYQELKNKLDSYH